jgi:steroid 5-alpha reductase family enzyme
MIPTLSFWQQLLLAWALAALAQTLAWAWQQRHANAGLVDVVWSYSLGAAALLAALTGAGALLPRVLLALLAGAWSLRLGTHILRRFRAESEDGRYAALRARWGAAPGKWLALFQLQALLVPLFALPFVAVAGNPQPHWHPAFVAAIAVWAVAVAGEALADAQLARFRADPGNRGRTCRAGLWRYSRHPNYFFEWLHWFAYVLLAVGAPLGWLAWAGPLVMYVFLRWISGIPWTEQQALRHRGEDYARYQRSTPMLFPWFPKEER